MSLTARIDHKVSEALVQYCLRTNTTKSDVVKQSLIEFLARQSLPPASPFELGADLFPQAGATPSGAAADLSTNRKTHLKARLNAKHIDRRGPANRGA